MSTRKGKAVKGTGKNATRRKKAVTPKRASVPHHAPDRESETKFRSLFEDAPIGIYKSSLEGRFLLVNSRLVHMLGYESQEEVLALNMGSDVYCDPNERASLIKHFLSEGKGTEIEVCWKKKNGTQFWVALSTYTVQNPDGSVNHFEGFVKDITLQKKAQEKLFQREEFFRSIIENSADAVALVDAGGNIQYTLQQDEDGYKPANVVGEKFFNRIHPEDRLYIQGKFQSVLSSPADRAIFTVRAHREDGELRYYDVAARNLIGNPSVKAIVVNFRDVTDRIIAEKRSRESQSQYRQVVEQASDGIMVVDPAGVLVYANEKLRQMTGLEEKELIGKSVMDTYPPGYEEEAAGNLEKAHAGDSANLSRMMRRRDGTSFPVEISVSRLPNGNFQGIVRDVTERKKAEQALRESEAKYRSLFEHLLNGFAYCEMIYEGEAAVDFVYLEVNESFERLTGMKGVTGKRVSEVIPGIAESNRELLDFYGRVAATGIPGQMESYVEPLDMWFSVSAYCPQKGFFVAIFDVITERKKAEEVLRESEEKFRSLAEESPNMIFINKNGRVVYANKRCEEIMGYTVEELITPSFNFRMLVDPESIPLIEKNLRLHQSGENIAPYEYGLLKKNGEKLFGLHSTRIINFEGGPAILGIVTDVTEQRKAVETQMRLLAAVEQSHDVIFITDVDGAITYVNPAFERVYGYSREEATGKTPRILKSGIYSKDYYGNFWQNLLEGNSLQTVVTNRARDGRLIDMEVSVSPVLGPDEQIKGFLAVQTDITQRKHAEDRVREQAALLDIATDAIVIIDCDGVIQFWNKSAERLYGWSAGDAVDQLFSEILNCSKSEVLRALDLTLTQGAWEGELMTTSRDRRSVVVQSRWTLRRDDNGTPRSILVVNSDITEKKVLQKQFYHSQRLDSLGTLAGGIAHDLNNVLSPILLSFEVLGRFVKEERAQRLLKTAYESANRGKQIVSQVLTFARGVEGKKGPVQIRHLADEAVNIIKETFPKSIDIQSTVEKNLWTINADPTQIHQIIMNLAVNARDSMPHGGILSMTVQNIELDEFFCRTQLKAHPGAYILMSVTDTGSGISSDIIDRIFDPFFTTKEVGKGTGLGLSTVHAIVTSHGGFVDVVSTVGKGTTFSVYLPATQNRLDHELLDGRAAASAVGSGERVLVIDDEYAIRDITEQVLSSAGFQVVTAADGVEAIATFADRGGEFDLVLTDLMMPGMDGVATVRALRRIKADIPVVVMSGMMTDEKIFQTQEFRPQAFLTKPFTSDTLLQAILKILRGSGEHSQK